jgi:hypothetical protein
MDKRELHCATCATVKLFEAPPCRDQDDHEDCPELVCTGCGGAILIAPIATVRVWLRPKGAIAPQQRRAA